MEVTGSLLIIKWEGFRALNDLIGISTSTDFNRSTVSDNRFQNLSQFLALKRSFRMSPVYSYISKMVNPFHTKTGGSWPWYKYYPTSYINGQEDSCPL